MRHLILCDLPKIAQFYWFF